MDKQQIQQLIKDSQVHRALRDYDNITSRAMFLRELVLTHVKEDPNHTDGYMTACEIVTLAKHTLIARIESLGHHLHVETKDEIEQMADNFYWVYWHGLRDRERQLSEKARSQPRDHRGRFVAAK